ncbi:MAG: AAA family ATPase [Thiotrichaceae bacterium]
MIKSLEIENFRCFGKSKLSGFARVNLIGGQNNSGKTAFLEALYLNRSPRAATVMKMRGISQESIKSFPERAWNGLFLNNDTKISGAIVSIEDNNNTIRLHLSYRHSSQPEIIQEYDVGFYITDTLREIHQIGSHCAVSENFILELSYLLNDQPLPSVLALMASIDNDGKIIKLGKKLPNGELKFQSISFISATEKASNRYLAEQYDKCYMQGYSDKVLDAFHIIDPSVVEIRTLMSGEPTVYLSRAKQRPMSLALFGDAMNRVAHVVLELLNNQSSILLIDEIENGLHHTHQKQLWQWLFALAVEFDVQIFATTHSLEMLTAFKEAAMGTQYESEVAYFEFARHVKTGEIIAVERDIDNLDYALERHKEVRGG